MSVAVALNTSRSGFPYPAASSRDFLSSYEKGISAESCAEKELKSKGYDILGKRVRTRYGEIDILARRDKDLVAVEVKQRRTLNDARCCLSTRQQSRIANALMYLASENGDLFENYRVDMVCLDSVGHFEYIENAFSIADFVDC
ncbi:MAG: YraN family protein [Holosporales bacterium]|jgi:putative endonuclease|nr:YraN family protein [Holosporales bacterium]